MAGRASSLITIKGTWLWGLFCVLDVQNAVSALLLQTARGIKLQKISVLSAKSLKSMRVAAKMFGGRVPNRPVKYLKWIVGEILRLRWWMSGQYGGTSTTVFQFDEIEWWLCCAILSRISIYLWKTCENMSRCKDVDKSVESEEPQQRQCDQDE
jgi:hypothetical protein